MAERMDIICGIKNVKTDKSYWTKVGVAFPSSRGGWSLYLDYLPTQRNDQGKMTFLMVEPKDDDSRPPRRSRDDERDPPEKNKRKADMDDEIPF